MDKIRISLAVDTEPRNAVETEKDSLLQNTYVDVDPEQRTYVVKRPGYYISNVSITTGSNRGIFINPNDDTPKVYYINSIGTLLFY